MHVARIEGTDVGVAAVVPCEGCRRERILM